MKIWERHALPVLPFALASALVRRALEEVRLLYWHRFYGWEIGAGVRVHLSVHIPKKLFVHLGAGAVIGRNTEVVTERRSGGSLIVGANVNIDQRCLLDATGDLVIGADATISEGVAIYTHSHGHDPRSKSNFYRLEIGERAWICTRAVVLSSARIIGAGAIVGPLTVVREPIPSNAILATGLKDTALASYSEGSKAQ